MEYVIGKWIHVLSSTIVFGTGMPGHGGLSCVRRARRARHLRSPDDGRLVVARGS